MILAGPFTIAILPSPMTVSCWIIMATSISGIGLVSAPVLPTLYHLKNELSPNKLQRRLECQISDRDVTFAHVL